MKKEENPKETAKRSRLSQRLRRSKARTQSRAYRMRRAKREEPARRKEKRRMRLEARGLYRCSATPWRTARQTRRATIRSPLPQVTDPADRPMGRETRFPSPWRPGRQPAVGGLRTPRATRLLAAGGASEIGIESAREYKGACIHDLQGLYCRSSRAWPLIFSKAKEVLTKIKVYA